MKTPADNDDPFENLKLLGAGTGFFNELCDMLSQCQLLKDLEWEEIKQIARYLQAYEAKDGVTLFHEGDAGNYLCFLGEGILRTSTHRGRTTFDVVTFHHDGSRHRQ